MNTSYDLPENYYFGGGGDSVVTPLALVLLLAAFALLLCIPRRRIIVVLLASGVLIPSATVIVTLGLHFPALRALVGVAWIRVLIDKNLRLPKLQLLDKLFLAWSISNAIAYALLWSDPAAFINRLGFLWTNVGVYFLARILIRDRHDVMLAIKTLAVLAVILAPAMLYEHLTQHNAFALLGAPAHSAIRSGAIRAEGPFAHPIIAGTITAVLMPLFAGMWQVERNQRLLAALGVAASLVIVVASASSTPLAVILAGILAMAAFPLRNRLRMIRWGFLLVLVCLQLAMKAPIWFLIARVGGRVGGSGFHRAMLIDTFVRNIGEWWLVGTRNNVSWGYDMWDAINAFVAAGVQGGLLTFALFVAIIVYAFRETGIALRAARDFRGETCLLWSIGAGIFANLAGFFGITYFDQSIMIWYCMLAMVAAAKGIVLEAKKADLPRPVRVPAGRVALEFPTAVRFATRSLES